MSVWQSADECTSLKKHDISTSEQRWGLYSIILSVEYKTELCSHWRETVWQGWALHPGLTRTSSWVQLMDEAKTTKRKLLQLSQQTFLVITGKKSELYFSFHTWRRQKQLTLTFSHTASLEKLRSSVHVWKLTIWCCLLTKGPISVLF